MDIQNLREKIVTIIAGHLKIDKSRVTDEATLTSLGADSLDQVEVVMQIEETFDIEVADDAIEKIQNVGALIEYVASLVKK